MEDEGLDLRAYWRILLRRWWIFVLGVVGAALAAFFISGAITPIYEAKTKVFVQGGQTPGAPSLGDIQTSEKLADNYGDLIKTRPVLEQVIQALSLPYSPDVLSDKLSVNSPRSLIEIKARDPDPQLAATIANTTAQTFIDHFREQQFKQISQFQASLSQFGIADDSSIVAAQAATISTLSIAEEALPPSSPSSPRTMLNVILAAVLGLLVAGLVVFLLEYLDNSIKSPEELKALTGMATLGSVPLHHTRDGLGPITLADEFQHSPLSESYKFLRINLDFAALGTEGLGALLVTSSGPTEGKTTTAANLAISMAKEGKSVILVDSDLRKPALHRIFDLGDHKGLTNLLLGNATLEEALAKTTVEGLRVIPSGPLPPDVTVVLRSPGMKKMVEQLKTSADLVVLDSPPLLAVSDAMVLAPLVDGALLVVDTKRSGRDAVKRGAESLRQATPSVMGTVLNKVTPKWGGYYHYYYYHYHYENSGKPRKGWLYHPRRLGLLTKVFRRGGKGRQDTGET